jgi:hypothetical protein
VTERKIGFRMGDEIEVMMIQPLFVSYCAISAVATIAYLAWGWARARGEAQ